VSLLSWVLVALAGAAAGAVNAIAGGGTLVTFPALLAVGLPPVSANITSSVGLVSGYAGGTVGYRRELAGQGPRVRALAAAAVIGGLVGAVVLLVTPADAFRAAVPYLVLAACALLAVQPRLARAVAARRERAAARQRGPGDGANRSSSPTGLSVGAAAVQVEAVPVAPLGWGVRAGVLVASVYGSYFGAGLGVLLLAVLGVLIADDLQRLNALKGLLSLVVNVVGVAVFVFSGRVDWPVALVIAVAAWVGGLLGVRVARVLPARVLRTLVVALGVVVAVVLLVRT
jgi:uncharacterized membrane protein YfcA